MRIVKFRIRNYKSIVDSGECYAGEAITIFAGKNEAGKTSILEALEDFSTSRTIRLGAKPIEREANPEVSVTFRIDNEVLERSSKNLLDSDLLPSSSLEIELVKSYPNTYSLGSHSAQADLFRQREEAGIKSSILEEWNDLAQVYAAHYHSESAFPDLDFDDLGGMGTALKRLNTEMEESSVIEAGIDPELLLGRTAQVLAEFEKLEQIMRQQNALLDALKLLIPNFILFSSFEDVFPNKIPSDELDKSVWAQDLSRISDLKTSVVTSATDRDSHKHKKQVNITLNAEYTNFWTQDVSNLSVDWDSEALYFWIEENNQPYEPSLRSKGRQWHLAFYIKISARARDDSPNVILIDEPGLFLHAKAQSDILRKLEAAAAQTQVFFSTHSPYLLEADKLDRIRLVHRTSEGGTRIENKVHALADKETLTPILTAIGLELSAGIHNIHTIHNVVAEGQSDVYYLNAFKFLLGDNSVNFVFGGGAGNMAIVGTVLHGWGCEVRYLFDNDQGRKDGAKNLKAKWSVPEGFILNVLESSGTIENLFSPNDFEKFVLGDLVVVTNETAAQFRRRPKQDKVLVAKLFLESVRDRKAVKLEAFGQATRGNIESLFEKIRLSFRDSKKPISPGQDTVER